MHRFYIPPQNCSGLTLFLSETEAHHANRVLRIQRGEPVIVLTGDGRSFHCKVEQCTRSSVELKVLRTELADSPAAQVTLIQAIPKGRLIEDIIEKATELGVSQVIPLITERVVPRFDAKEAAEKAAKWQAVAISAMKQSGCAWLPRVGVPVALEALTKCPPVAELQLVGSLASGAQHPSRFFDAFVASESRKPKTVAVWIGPEGDFTPAELRMICGAGALPMTFGPLVLRCETAATCALAVAAHELSRPGGGPC